MQPRPQLLPLQAVQGSAHPGVVHLTQVVVQVMGVLLAKELDLVDFNIIKIASHEHTNICNNTINNCVF